MGAQRLFYARFAALCIRSSVFDGFGLNVCRVNSQVDPRISTTQSADLLQWTTAKTMKVLSNTTLTTKAVLHAVSDRQWWKKSLTYLRPLHVRNNCVNGSSLLALVT